MGDTDVSKRSDHPVTTSTIATAQQETHSGVLTLPLVDEAAHGSRWQMSNRLHGLETRVTTIAALVVSSTLLVILGKEGDGFGSYPAVYVWYDGTAVRSDECAVGFGFGFWVLSSAVEVQSGVG